MDRQERNESAYSDSSPAAAPTPPAPRPTPHAPTALPPRSGFLAHFRGRYPEMDALGHVNNAVYLHYLEQAAIEHSSALGFTSELLDRLGGLFIARRHEIDYLRPAVVGDLLQV